MSLLSEGASITRPSLLDGINYPFWKTRMRAFIRALDMRAWRSILIGWSHPTTKDSKGNEIPKVEIDWSNDDDKLENFNNKALNSIFKGVNVKQIKLISSCESAKKAWDVFQITCEGSSDVKHNKLLTLTTRFENLHMLEEESLSSFILSYVILLINLLHLVKRYLNLCL